MRTRRPIARFIGMFAVLYGLLIAPWPGINKAYGSYFMAFGRVAFSELRGHRILRFEAAEPSPHPVDVKITMANVEKLDAQGRGHARILFLDSRSVGWVPTALVLALILATPVPWARRAWALFWGLLLVHGYIAFAVACYVWNESSDLNLVALTPFWKEVVSGLEETLVTQLGASFVVPFLIWLVVAFRPRDFAAVRDARQGAGSCAEPGP
jgi:hypothetical protein